MIDTNLIISIFILNETDLMSIIIDNLIMTFDGANWKARKPNICFAGCEWRCNELEY